MAIEKFWGSVRTAMQFVEEDAQSTAWMNRHAVDGFDPRDFDFLADSERERLEASVAAFRMSVAKVAPPQPPSAAQLEEGNRSFGEILGILDPNRNYDPDFFRIKKILDAELEGKLPDWVERLVYEPTLGSQGEEGVRVWVVFSDEASRDGRVKAEQIGEVRETVEAAYRWTGSPLFLMVRFQTQAKLDAAKVGGRRAWQTTCSGWPARWPNRPIRHGSKRDCAGPPRRLTTPCSTSWSNRRPRDSSMIR